MSGLGESILEEGRLQGRKREQAQIIENMLRKGKTEKEICDLTDYPETVIREVKERIYSTIV